MEVLVNEERFEDLIDYYPSFLRQPTLASLHRMFAVYEFRTENLQKAGWIRYSHPYFVRGEPDLLELFVLSHQTRRYNARRARPDTEDHKLRKTARHSFEDFSRKPVNIIDSEDDLQPICSSSLFQFTLAAGLDVDSSAAEQCPMTTNSQRRLQREEYSADCSLIVETEPSDVHGSEVSFCAKKIRQNSETWMSQMSENEEWFGLNGQPLAVPVCCDFRQHEAVNNGLPTYANLQQMQHYEDM